MSGVFIRQIFYNETTRQELDPGFIPLDNSSNDRPDWYELWPIRNFLRSTALEEGSWYGFVSTGFEAKTGVNSGYVYRLLDKIRDKNDVLLLSPGWEQIAYFRNVFEQGDVHHPGLLVESQKFADHLNLSLNLAEMVTHSLTSVFSNYLIATPNYWRAWLELANALFEYVENQGGQSLSADTRYGVSAAPLKAFVQERLSAIILAGGHHRVIAYDPSPFAPLAPILLDHPDTRRMLQTCDELKRLYCAFKDPKYLERYYDIRSRVPFLRQRGFIPIEEKS